MAAAVHGLLSCAGGMDGASALSSEAHDTKAARRGKRKRPCITPTAHSVHSVAGCGLSAEEGVLGVLPDAVLASVVSFLPPTQVGTHR